MKSWARKTITFDNASPGDMLKAEFLFLGDFDEIVTATSSCGCASPKLDKKNKKIIVNYQAGEIPYHLAARGANSYYVSHTITVHYKDGNLDHLTFKVTIKK